MIVSLLSKVTRKLLSLPSLLLRGDAAKDAELLLVLRPENAALHRQSAGPVRYEPVDRFRCAALSGLIPRCRRREVFPVTLGTLLGRRRRLVAVKGDYSARGRAGRPPTATALMNLVLRLAGENPRGGPGGSTERRRGSGTGSPLDGGGDAPRGGHRPRAASFWSDLA